MQSARRQVTIGHLNWLPKPLAFRRMGRRAGHSYKTGSCYQLANGDFGVGLDGGSVRDVEGQRWSVTDEAVSGVWGGTCRDTSAEGRPGASTFAISC